MRMSFNFFFFIYQMSYYAKSKFYSTLLRNVCLKTFSNLNLKGDNKMNGKRTLFSLGFTFIYLVRFPQISIAYLILLDIYLLIRNCWFFKNC